MGMIQRVNEENKAKRQDSIEVIGNLEGGVKCEKNFIVKNS